jgi:O-antigen ligase
MRVVVCPVGSSLNSRWLWNGGGSRAGRGFYILMFAVSEATMLMAQSGQDEKQCGTISSRSGWWSTGWQKYLERRLTGYAAYAGGRFVTPAEVQTTGSITSSLHSTYFETLLGTGPWGILPVVAALIGTWRLMLKALTRSVGMTLKKEWILEALAVLALVTMRSAFTSHLIWHPSLSFLVVFGSAEFLRRKHAGLIRQPAVVRVVVGGQSVDIR